MLLILIAALGAVAGAPVLTGDRSAAQAEASRDPSAEAFVQAEGQRIVSILDDRSRGLGERIRAFRAVVDEIADVPRISRFVLGKYARSITPAQMERFGPIFREYAQHVYQQRLSDFRGDTLTVTGSQVRKPGDVVVSTTISGGEATRPAKISWRVLGAGGRWKVVDVEFSGIWLAIAQQEDFVSTIDNHGGDVDALISQIEALTKRRARADSR